MHRNRAENVTTVLPANKPEGRLVGLAGPRAPTTRQSFYFGLVVMLLNTGLQLNCLWKIFGWPAIVLWLPRRFF